MDWDDYYMGFAEFAALKSKDTTKVGAILVGKDGEILLTAFNGPPKGVNDKPDRFDRPAKYLYASHAEANLVSFAARNGIHTHGCSVVVTHQPCASCMRTLIQAGIHTVIYGPGTTSMPAEEFNASHRMAIEAGVEIISHQGGSLQAQLARMAPLPPVQGAATPPVGTPPAGGSTTAPAAQGPAASIAGAGPQPPVAPAPLYNEGMNRNVPRYEVEVHDYYFNAGWNKALQEVLIFVDAMSLSTYTATAIKKKIERLRKLDSRPRPW